MNVQATLPNLRISPRKTRLVTRALVGASVDEALLQLRKQTKKASSPLAVLIESAIANAEHNHGMARKDLIVADVRVGDGMRLKRWLPRAFGRATPLIRRGCNVTVIVTTAAAKAPVEAAKVAAKKVTKKVAKKVTKKVVTKEEKNA
jgi:large subunit ribosomal protein L22